VAENGGAFIVWDVKEGRKHAEFSAGLARSVYTYVSPNGRYAVAFAGGATVVDLEERKVVARVEGLQRHYAVFSGDSRFVMGIDARGEAVVWEARTGVEKLRFSAEGSSITSYCFSPDGRWVAVADAEGRLRIADARSGKLSRTAQVPGAEAGGEGSVYQMAFDRRGHRLTLIGAGTRIVTFSNNLR